MSVRWRGATARLGESLRTRFLDPPHPEVAIEFRNGAVGLVRLSREAELRLVGAALEAPLPAGAVLTSLTQPNVVDGQAVRDALRGLVQQAELPRGTGVALVLPDPTARVAIVPGEELRVGRGADAEEVLRFRIRKGLPFDVREARVSHVALGAGSREPATLIAAVRRDVLRGYESSLEDCGLEVGLVELAGLALARAAAGGGGDQLLVNWEVGYLSLLLLTDGQPALVRTLGHDVAGRPEEVEREVSTTLVYYREKLAGAGLARALLRCTVLPLEEASARIAGALGVEPRAFEWSAGPGVDRARLGQALAAAAACVLVGGQR